MVDFKKRHDKEKEAMDALNAEYEIDLLKIGFENGYKSAERGENLIKGFKNFFKEYKKGVK